MENQSPRLGYRGRYPNKNLRDSLLNLNDNAWMSLANTSSDPTVVPRRLESLYENPNDLDAIRDLASLVRTRDGILSAAYAVAPHFLALRNDDQSQWDAKYHLLIEAGKFALFDRTEYQLGQLVSPELGTVADDYNWAINTVANALGMYLVPEFSVCAKEVSAVFLGCTGQRELGLAILQLDGPATHFTDNLG
ncbi:hypothetical protein [Crateriforma conspicua]|uniref:Uncharacterized protein n=1 Tax=Crateriforma conspicua TaxID=2527996 RepID=A0A5C5YC36_9PLAN|nr:hypothetical protein [Crateriforma conspicua]TWT72664.1 hypothetical protein Pan14r_49840 [Crateriforma conspicua]